MMKSLFGLLISLLVGQVFARDIWQFQEPKIGIGSYSITDTVYMSLAGNDTNSGTRNHPVGTFQKALQLLPFGTPGVNGGQAYGLVRLLPGRYILTSGLQQGIAQFQQGSTYKNVSIEGIGEVMIEGTQDTFMSGHAVRLMGSHIFVKNLKIRYADIHGILISGSSRINNVLIDNVIVDSVKSFCMLFHEVDTILVRNSSALHGSRPGADLLTTGCQWPSGIKFYGCTWATIHDSEIAYTRGEGLNFHNTEYGLAFNNSLHDNPTNIYCDNSARIIIRNNFNYATPGNEIYWRTCPAENFPIYGSKGILLANEGACGVGGPSYQYCRTVCPLENKSYAQVDSIFIYNNFFVNTIPALNLWQGNTTAFPGFNCVRNVFFYHNTVVGVTGDPAAGNAAMIYAFFPNFYNTLLNQGFAIAENINVYGNIISYNTKQYPQIQPINIVRDGTFPVPFELNVAHNRLIETDDELSSTDQVDTTLRISVDPVIDSVLKQLQPCSEHPNLVQSISDTGWVTEDFKYRVRSNPTNVGALEYDSLCIVADTVVVDTLTEDTVSSIAESSFSFHMYPNPAKDVLMLSRSFSKGSLSVACTDLAGKVLITKEWPANQFKLHLPLNELSDGLYFLVITNTAGARRSLRFVKF